MANDLVTSRLCVSLITWAASAIWAPQLAGLGLGLIVGTAPAEPLIKLAEPSKLAYRCGNTYTDSEEEARSRGCKLVSADPSVLEQLNVTGRYREIAANSNLKIFIDKSKTGRDGKLLKSWSVLSYHKPQPMSGSDTFQSVQSLEYYDCANHTSATKRQVYYKDKITQGEVVGSVDLAFKFEQDPPGSMGELVMQYLCAN
ncbi:MAG: hypothetical protein IPJ18_11100 [Betaproteobacteria bacterium]|nr:hypothetical protein [Betaproteobacteria bacterium]